MKLNARTCAALFGGWFAACVWAGADRPTAFSNQGGVKNTRHNLTQSTMQNPTAGGEAAMDPYRNDYGEVCVYCHTPHGSNTTIKAPLWNRTVKQTTYDTYDELNTDTLTQTVTQPGANSLTCLTCHDGQTAIDSIINMPGSGRYSADQMTSMSNSFLNSWPGTGATDNHQGLASNSNSPTSNSNCLSCHTPGGLTPSATDFTVFLIGTDLRNDHPVGVTFPVGNSDFKSPNGNRNGTLFFDSTNPGHMDKNEIRVYDTGEGPEVECASCHDPHGVPSGGPGSQHIGSFLRVNNTQQSAVCMTCHDK